jgi:hypothetical protein
MRRQTWSTGLARSRVETGSGGCRQPGLRQASMWWPWRRRISTEMAGIWLRRQHHPVNRTAHAKRPDGGVQKRRALWQATRHRRHRHWRTQDRTAREATGSARAHIPHLRVAGIGHGPLATKKDGSSPAPKERFIPWIKGRNARRSTTAKERAESSRRIRQNTPRSAESPSKRRPTRGIPSVNPDDSERQIDRRRGNDE